MPINWMYMKVGLHNISDSHECMHTRSVTGMSILLVKWWCVLNTDVSWKSVQIYHTEYQAQHQHRFQLILNYSSRARYIVSRPVICRLDVGIVMEWISLQIKFYYLARMYSATPMNQM